MKQQSEHITFENQKLFCLNCGGDFTIPFPIAISEMTKKIKDFNLLHKDCEKIWKEPIANQSKDVKEKAMFWMNTGEKGASSKTMWNCLIGNKYFPINYPYDEDDFKRCYKLLNTVPEWKKQLHKLKPLSKAWSNLVDNWDKLTAMYEQNVKEGWKNYKRIGMYEFMQTLIR